jgi:hypothetical protein
MNTVVSVLSSFGQMMPFNSGVLAHKNGSVADEVTNLSFAQLIDNGRMKSGCQF